MVTRLTTFHLSFTFPFPSLQFLHPTKTKKYRYWLNYFQDSKLKKVEAMKATLIFNLAKVKEEDTQFYLQKGFKITATDNNPSEIQAAYAKYKSYVDSKQLQFMNYNFSNEKDLPFSLSSGE